VTNSHRSPHITKDSSQSRRRRKGTRGMLMSGHTLPLHAQSSSRKVWGWNKSLLPLHAQAPRVPDFEFPNSESGMGYGPVREILARGRRGRTSSVSPGRTLDVRWGGAKPGGVVDWQGRKEGNRVDAGSGQQKAPRGNLGDAGE
jgi:hypothetical protein